MRIVGRSDIVPIVALPPTSFRQSRLWCRPCSGRHRHAQQRASGSRHRREVERLRARRRRPERHAARFLLAALLATVVLLTLLLTAFGSGAPTRSRRSRSRRRPCSRAGSRCARSSPRRERSTCSSPSQSAVTAIGYHHAGDGSLMLDPIGRQGNAASSRGSSTSSPARARRASSGTSSRRPRPGHFRALGRRRSGHDVIARRRHGRRDHRLRALEPDLRGADRHQAARGAVRRRLPDASPGRPGADRRLQRPEGARPRSASSST